MAISKPTAYPNTNSRPTWSPDGKRVMADLGSQTVVVDRENPEQQDVFSSKTTWVNYPDWNPKGDRIAFSAHAAKAEGEAASWGIYTCDEEGGDFKRIIDDAKEGEWNTPGDKIAYLTKAGGSRTRIGVANADGSNQNLVGIEGLLQNDLSWDPQGHQVAYETYHGGEFQIRIADFTGKKDRLVTNGITGTYKDRTPEWSPDGKKILFERHDRNDPQSDLVLVDINTRKELQITHFPGRVYDPAWSPDGKKIAFLSNKDNIKQNDFDLFIMDADGKNVEKLSGMKGDEYAPSFSPDGKAIAFTKIDWSKAREERYSLHIVELEGQN